MRTVGATIRTAPRSLVVHAGASFSVMYSRHRPEIVDDVFVDGPHARESIMAQSVLALNADAAAWGEEHVA